MKLKERFKISRFTRGELPQDEAITLTHRRIFILPTQRGWAMVLLIVILLLIAFVYNNNLAYMLTFLVASVFFITTMHTFKSLAGLVIQAGQTQPVFVGEAAGFDFHITNPLANTRPHCQIKLAKAQSFSLSPYSKISQTLYMVVQKRGWHIVDTVTVFSTYPLGLFYAWSPLRFNSQVLVYPRPSPLELPFPNTPSDDAERGQSYKGNDDFYGLQDYQAGDAIKHIHWKAFAKGQGLYSKQYSGAKSSTEVWLQYDDAPGYTLEDRISQLCRWVVDAEQLDMRYGLILPTIKLPPNRGSVHYHQCLEALALL